MPDELDDGELDLVRRLQAEKYDTWEWVFGRSPAYDLRNRRWWNGGELEVRASITRERIDDIRFFGDFLSLVPLGTLTDELVGYPYRRDTVREVLERHAIGGPVWRHHDGGGPGDVLSRVGRPLGAPASRRFRPLSGGTDGPIRPPVPCASPALIV